MLISAFLEDGAFLPERHHVKDTDLSCWQQLWSFCCDYQAKTGNAPPIALIRRKFPDFEVTPDVDIVWAAGQLREKAWARDFRFRTHQALTAIGDGDVNAAFDTMSAINPPAGVPRTGMGVFDVESVLTREVKPAIDVPYTALMKSTNGIGPGQLWYLVARLGQGKTWQLCNYAAAAAKAGYKVRYYSLEMPVRTITRRLQTVLAGREPGLVRKLTDPSENVRREALEMLANRIPGHVETLDPSSGRVTTEGIRDGMVDADLIVIDHVGLMGTNAGGRAVDDWRAMALISNQLKEECLASGVPVIAAAQANRQADTSSTNPPKTSQISQSDALGQDADVVVSMKRLSESVMVHSAIKVREGPEAKWYSRFEPTKGRFDEISKEQAMELGVQDEDRAAS